MHNIDRLVGEQNPSFKTLPSTGAPDFSFSDMAKTPGKTLTLMGAEVRRDANESSAHARCSSTDFVPPLIRRCPTRHENTLRKGGRWQAGATYNRKLTYGNARLRCHWSSRLRCQRCLQGGGMKNTFFECTVGEHKMLIMWGLGRFSLAYDQYQPLPRD